MVSTFSEQMLRSVYSTVHALGVVPEVHSLGRVLAGTIPRACIVEYLLLNVCSEKSESVSQNTLCKVGCTSRVKTKYITFKNWIM